MCDRTAGLPLEAMRTQGCGSGQNAAEKYRPRTYLFNEGIAGLPGTLITLLTDVHPARNARNV
jgi:hypothetical protein